MPNEDPDLDHNIDHDDDDDDEEEVNTTHFNQAPPQHHILQVPHIILVKSMK